jgi:hypothetical protein
MKAGHRRRRPATGGVNNGRSGRDLHDPDTKAGSLWVHQRTTPSAGSDGPLEPRSDGEERPAPVFGRR